MGASALDWDFNESDDFHYADFKYSDKLLTVSCFEDDDEDDALLIGDHYYDIGWEQCFEDEGRYRYLHIDEDKEDVIRAFEEAIAGKDIPSERIPDHRFFFPGWEDKLGLAAEEFVESNNLWGDFEAKWADGKGSLVFKSPIKCRLSLVGLIHPSTSVTRVDFFFDDGEIVVSARK